MSAMSRATLGESKPRLSPQGQYRPKIYDHLIGMEGFSEKLLKNHFKLYQGYVTNTNAQLDLLSDLLKQGRNKSPEFAEVKRRLGWEFNGMRLHEYYFDNLGGKDPLDENSLLAQMIRSQFGGYKNWETDFLSTGAMRGIGWAVLYLDPQTSRLMNFWVEEHNVNHIAGSEPLLIMDVFEHAFMIDYGTEKAKYMEAFIKNINWSMAVERCRTAMENQ